MKNYFKWIVIDKKDLIEKKFIIKYELIDGKNKIKIFYADGSINVVDYTNEREKSIILLMQEQISNNSDFLEDSFKDDISLLNSLLFFSILIMIMGIGNFFIGNGALVSKIINCFLFGIAGLGFGITGFVFVLHNKYFNDYKKNKLFIENKNKIIEFLETKKTIVVENKENVKNVCSSRSNDMCDVNINSIDNMSLGDMKQLLKKIKKELVGEDDSKNELLDKGRCKKIINWINENLVGDWWKKRITKKTKEKFPEIVLEKY